MLPESPPRINPLTLRPDQEQELTENVALSVQAFRTTITLAARMRTVMDQRLREDGITTQQAALITIVEAHGTPSLTEAAEALGCTRQNLKQIANALQRKGFLQIRPDPQDARTSRLVATARSREYWAARDDGDVHAVADWFADLDPDELRTLVHTLGRVHRRVNPETRG